MFILKFIMKFIKVLGSETAPSALASAVLLGMLMGFSPLLSLQGLIIVAILLFLCVNIAGFLFSWAIFKIIFIVCSSPLDAFGAGLLESESLNGLWTSLYHSVFYYTGFSNSLVLGGIVVSLILAVPIFLLALLGVRCYRKSLEPKILNSKLYKAIKASKAYALYRTLTSPLGGGDE